MELIVISDLHLSDGYSKETQKYSRKEDFLFDEEFKRFLEYLEGKNTSFHLIIAGDMFDFLQVDPDCSKLKDPPKVNNKKLFEISGSERKFGLGTEVTKTVLKLKEIANGHEVFFKALAEFISKGNPLSIIHGNHDIELYWTDVQKELKNQIAINHPSKKRIKELINFYPWFYYDKIHKTYIEHGNQYDPFNSFKFFLNPLLFPGSDKLWLPFGSFFVRYFFNKLEESNPFADNIKPFTQYFRWSWKEHRLEFLKNIPLYLFTMFRVFLKSGIINKSTKKELEKKNDEKIEIYARQFDLPLDSVKQVYSLMAPPFSRSKCRVLLNIAGIVLFILTAVTFCMVFILAEPLDYSPWIALYSLGLLLIAPISKWFNSLMTKDIIEKSYPEIKKYLTDYVQIIVFGHTHDPKIEISDKMYCYYNTGTWTTVFSEEERIIRERKQFPFLWIKEGKDDTPLATLYRWNDSLKQHEKLILLEPKPR